MKTISSTGDEEPSWLKDPAPAPLELSLGIGNPFQGEAASIDALRRQGTVRLRRRRSYTDSDEDDNEDCCCCPQDPCLIAFTLFHFVAGCLGVASIGANAYHLTQPNEGTKYIDIIQRCYVIGFGAIIVLTESEFKFLMRRLKLLDLWVFRGFFYAYVGLNTLDLFSPTVETPECIVGFALIVLGAMYVVMGALCLKTVALARRKGAYNEIPESTVYESV